MRHQTRAFRAYKCAARLLVPAILLAWSGLALAAGPKPGGYASPDQAVDALLVAVRSGPAEAIEHVLGRGSGRLVDSGDAVADRADRAAFAAAFDRGHKIERRGNDTALLLIGEEQWPFPIPLRERGGAWRFDARAGAEEILNRRVGRNELNAIETCLAIVDAEKDYASDERTGSGTVEYARRFVSRPGKTDGLYWPAAPGAPESPLGPLLAAAQAEGYGHGRAPYHGYYYRILTGQGPHAPGGPRDYVVSGHMIGGFALLAYPAKWGDSGVKTFIVNQDGIVHEKNLGRGTERAAHALTRYDPDPSWAVAERPAR